VSAGSVGAAPWASSVGQPEIRGFPPTKTPIVAAPAKDSSDPGPSPREDV